MATEKFGIDALKEVAAFAVSIGKQISNDLSDGKVSLTEGLALLPSFIQVPGLISKKDEILNELKDLSLNEVNELVASVDGQISSEDLIGTLTDALNFAVSAKNLVERFVKKPQA